ncbi:MAG: hypothetical protein ACE5FD_18180 [Anaerolineae bacterium]
MSRFFQHDTATPPASWWSAEAAGRFLKPADAGEEEAMHAPSAEDMMADVIGHDLAAAAGPLLTHADLDEQTKQRFSDGLARMVSPETLQALASRQTERTRHQLCPAGLLFAPPRIGADDDLPEDMRRCNPGPGKDFLPQFIPHKSVRHVQSSVHQVPRQAVCAEGTVKNIEEKIGHLVERRKAEAIQHIRKRRPVQPPLQTREISDKPRPYRTAEEQMGACEQEQEHEKVAPEKAALLKCGHRIFWL